MQAEFYSLLEEKFWEFHKRNPRVYELLVHFAREWKSKNHRESCGINMLIERVRWEVNISLVDYTKPALKINNNHAPFYARLIMEQEKDLKGMFKMRKQRIQATIGPQNETLEDNIHFL